MGLLGMGELCAISRQKRRRPRLLGLRLLLCSCQRLGYLGGCCHAFVLWMCRCRCKLRCRSNDGFCRRFVEAAHGITNLRKITGQSGQTLVVKVWSRRRRAVWWG